MRFYKIDHNNRHLCNGGVVSSSLRENARFRHASGKKIQIDFLHIYMRIRTRSQQPIPYEFRQKFIFKFFHLSGQSLFFL